MREIEWTETDPTVGRMRGDEASLHVSARSSHKNALTLQVVIPETLMRAAGLRAGDAVRFVEAGYLVGIQRTAEARHHLSPRIGGKAADSAGKSVRAAVSRTMTARLHTLWLGGGDDRIAKAQTGDGWVAIRMAE